MNVTDERHRKWQFVQSQHPLEQTEFEKPGYKTDEKCDTHSEINTPFDDYYLHTTTLYPIT